MVVRLVIPVLVVTMALAACSSTPEPTERTLAYSKILWDSPAGTQQVGWLEKRESVDARGVRAVLDLVKDMTFDVRGYIRANGRAVKVDVKTPAQVHALGEKRGMIDLEPASRDYLVSQMLDLPYAAKVTFVHATSADVRQ